MINMIIILFFCVIVSIVIYIIQNKEYVKKKVKINKKIFYVVLIIICLLIVYMIYENINKSIENIKFFISCKNDNETYEFYDQKIKEENDFYIGEINKNYKENNYSKPYIPDGFEYVEGEWKTGYVIQDENQNQYVWIPCSNQTNINAQKLEKINFNNPAFISKDTCFDEYYKDFIVSALTNGGFYISRFEIGKEDEKPVSKYGVEIWRGLNKSEAIQVINNMYNTDKFTCQLINGIAYDTTLSWIMKNNEIEKKQINFMDEKQTYFTGTLKYNNIYDITDNSLELTLENSYGTVIIRGFATEDLKDESRYNILEEDNFFGPNTILTFRTIIYK